jgi:hypothetical protein
MIINNSNMALAEREREREREREGSLPRKSFPTKIS